MMEVDEDNEIDLDGAPEGQTDLLDGNMQLLSDLRMELVKALNNAQTSPAIDSKQSFLTQATEIVFHRDPTNSSDCVLLLEFIADLCEFISQENIAMKRFVVEYLETAGKACKDTLPYVLPALSKALSVDHASLVKRVLIAVNNLYRPALVFLCDAALAEVEDVTHLIPVMDTLRAKALGLMSSNHLAVSMAAVKTLQTIALAFLAPEASGPVTVSGREDNIRPTTGPDAFTLMSVPRGQSVILPAKLENDGKAIVNRLIKAFETLDDNDRVDETRGVLLVNALSSIALHRPAVRQQIMSTLLKKGEAFKRTEESLRFGQSLKANFVPLLKVHAMSEWASKVEAVLTKLGAATKLIGAAKKQAERATRSKKRARDRDAEDARISMQTDNLGLPEVMLKDPKLPTFSPIQALDFRKMAVQRMIDCCKTGKFDKLVNVMVARVASDFIPPQVTSQETITPVKRSSKRKREEETAVKADKVEEEDDLTRIVDLRKPVVEYIVEDPEGRMSLAAALLLHEFSYDTVAEGLRSATKKKPRNFHRYDSIFMMIMHRLEESTTLLQLLKNVPRVPEQALQEVFQKCVDPVQLSLGFLILRDVLSSRQSLRFRCIKAVVYFTLHKDPNVRKAATALLVARIFPENEFAQQNIRDYAVQVLNALKNNDDVVKVIANEAEINLPEEEVIVKSEKKAKIESEEQDDEETEEIDAATVERLDCSFSLFLSLCTIQSNVVEHNLLAVLMETFPLLPDYAQNHLLEMQNFARLLGKLKDELGSTVVFKLFATKYKPEGGGLMVVVMDSLADVTQDASEASELTNAYLDTVCEGGQVLTADIQMLLPVIGFLKKDDVFALMPTLLELEKEETEKGLLRILNSPMRATEEETPDVATPKDILLAIVTEDGATDQAKIVASDVCLTQRQLFTKDCLKEAIEELTSKSDIPKLSMRIILVSLDLEPGLKSFVVDVLHGLRQRQVWTMKVEIWHGFLFCAHKLQTNGFPVFLFLPAEQLSEAMTFVKKHKKVDLQPKLKYYYRMNKEKLSNVTPEVVEVLSAKKNAHLGLSG